MYFNQCSDNICLGVALDLRFLYACCVCCLPLTMSSHLRLVLTCYLLLQFFLVSAINDVSRWSGPSYVWSLQCLAPRLSYEIRFYFPWQFITFMSWGFPCHVGPIHFPVINRKHIALLNAWVQCSWQDVRTPHWYILNFCFREAASCEWNCVCLRSKNVKSRHAIALWVYIVYSYSYTQHLEDEERMSKRENFLLNCTRIFFVGIKAETAK